MSYTSEEVKAMVDYYKAHPEQQAQRYVPLGQHQEQRLINMLELDNHDEFYKVVNMRDLRLMQSLLKRDLVYCVEGDWFLSDIGRVAAHKLVVADADWLPF